VLGFGPLHISTASHFRDYRSGGDRSTFAIAAWDRTLLITEARQRKAIHQANAITRASARKSAL
jgi:hypothetical protein